MNILFQIFRDPFNTVSFKHYVEINTDSVCVFTAVTSTQLSLCDVVSVQHIQLDFSEIRVLTTWRVNTKTLLV